MTTKELVEKIESDHELSDDGVNVISLDNLECILSDFLGEIIRLETD